MTEEIKRPTDGKPGSADQYQSVEPQIPKVEPLPISDLRPYRRNPKNHSKRQIRQIASSIEEFKFIVPMVVDAEYCIIAGHGRLEAAKLLGLKSVPVIRAEHLTEAQVRAYRLADNKIAENATWDENLLTIELNGILDLDVNFDLELTGFDTGEIDIHLGIGEAEEVETVPAPEHAGRRGYGIEIDPHYADLILRRLETETGETAVHGETGLSFAEMTKKRVGGLANV